MNWLVKGVITYLHMGYIGDNPFTDHLLTFWDIQVRLRVGGWYVLLLMVLKSGYCNRLRERPLLKGKPGLFVLGGFCHEYLETQPGTESMNCWLVKLFRVLDWWNFKQLRDFKNPFFWPSHTEKGWIAIEYNICLHVYIYIYIHVNILVTMTTQGVLVRS